MRILLAAMSDMLSGIVHAALDQSPDIIVAGTANEKDDVAARVAGVQADALIIQVTEPGNFEAFRPLLMAFPVLKVIGISSDGKRGFLYELEPRSTRLVELSMATLLAALHLNPLPPAL
jgi:chemotaxis response regulator CheB